MLLLLFPDTLHAEDLLFLRLQNVLAKELHCILLDDGESDSTPQVLDMEFLLFRCHPFELFVDPLVSGSGDLGHGHFTSLYPFFYLLNLIQSGGGCLGFGFLSIKDKVLQINSPFSHGIVL